MKLLHRQPKCQVTLRFLISIEGLIKTGRLPDWSYVAIALEINISVLDMIRMGLIELHVDHIGIAIQKWNINPMWLFTGEGQRFVGWERSATSLTAVAS